MTTVTEDLAWFTSRLHDHLDAYLALTESQIENLYRHYDLLTRWNRKINLTSIRTPEEIVVRHYCESLFFAAHVPADWNDLADIGSGPGFPGVPMAVLRPDWQITLVESHQRKSVFLRESTRHLKNVSVVAQRAEQLTRPYGALVSRAVNPEEILSLAPRLARRVGLLIGASDYSASECKANWTWQSIAIPWAERRLAVFGLLQLHA